MLKHQTSLPLSQYTELYALLIPTDHKLRRINDIVDFQFVYDELAHNYCLDDGRNAIDPVQMFKYLFLKELYALSDRDLIERAHTDLAFKFFLGLTPEAEVIDPSSLTKFRRLRLKDETLLNSLIARSIAIAIEHNLVNSRSIIIDATHTKTRFNQKTPVEVLRHYSKAVRKELYAVDESIKTKLPTKNDRDDFEQEKHYTKKLIDFVEKQSLSKLPRIAEPFNLLIEKLDDINTASVESVDPDAKVGHKSHDTSFIGYKTHLAMTEERLITAAVITSGEKGDGQYLPKLIELTQANGIEIDSAIADRAYSGKTNLDYAEEHQLKLYARLNPTISECELREGWDYNKDADRVICPAGHMAFKKYKAGTSRTTQNRYDAYFFDVQKCRVCPLREGCYQPGAKTKTYSRTILAGTHKKQMDFQKTPEFIENVKHRYKIEAKNAELKQRHGYDRSESRGLFGMNIQAALTIFTVNIKRIVQLIDEK